MIPVTPASPSQSSFMMTITSSGGVGGGGSIGWPFGNKSKMSLAVPLTKAQRVEEKKRKKEESRAHKEQLMASIPRVNRTDVETLRPSFGVRPPAHLLPPLSSDRTC